MRKYTIESLRHLRLARGKPMPFPGRYPTKIGMKVVLVDRPPICYVGKPSTRVFNQFYRLVKGEKGFQGVSFFILEFDRGGLLWRKGGLSPSTDISSQKLLAYYHPWRPSGTFGFERVVKLKDARDPKMIHRIYSPFKTGVKDKADAWRKSMTELGFM